MQHSSTFSSMQSVCTVRLTKPSDYDRMADMAGQLGYCCTGHQIEKRIAEMKDMNQYAVYVAQLSGGVVAGWIGVYIFRSVELDGCAEISGLVVDEQVRSRGIGEMLLDAAEKWARNRGCRAICVHSNVKRDRAHRFYTEHAYQHIKSQKLFQKIL